MTALSFDMLDRHVVTGRGDDIACTDATGSLSFARLLERSAALAGGLAVLGIRPDDGVELDLPNGNGRVIAVCALIRLGARPATGTDTRIVMVHGAASVRINDNDIELALVERAGRSDPLPAGTVDEPGYTDAVADVFGDIVGPLLSGSPVV
ncbi:MAG TPA: AMP-binding protein [Aeromicrobium sp.]|nr:AMP-binding protein [Aeromicrobium sp.]